MKYYKVSKDGEIYPCFLRFKAGVNFMAEGTNRYFDIVKAREAAQRLYKAESGHHPVKFGYSGAEQPESACMGL